MDAKRKIQKRRVDMLLVERGLAESRQQAQALILAGQVLVRGQKAAKAGSLVAADLPIEILGESQPFASRGGLKLEGALADFGIDPTGKVCLDIGSSTGGFTDCLLKHGASRVYAVDVNVDQLAWKLRQDPRVIKVKKNARYLKFDDVGDFADLVTMDVSFISVSKILPAACPLLKPTGELLILVKPQFELDRANVSRGGIVMDPVLHQRAIDHVRAAVGAARFLVVQICASRLPGAEGNQEFFLHARPTPLE